jgi:hypothetical protein
MVCPPPDSSDANSDGGDKTTVLHGDQETLKKELARAKEQEACLIIIRGTPQGHRFFITQEEMTIAEILRRISVFLTKVFRVNTPGLTEKTAKFA